MKLERIIAENLDDTESVIAALLMDDESDGPGRLLDEAVYPTTQLDEDEARIARRRGEIEEIRDEHERAYRNVLEDVKGADEATKRQCARSAKLIKKSTRRRRRSIANTVPC
jgi:hypothetical protein